VEERVLEVDVEEIVHSRMADSHAAGSRSSFTMDVTAHGMYTEALDAPEVETAGKKSSSFARLGSFMFDKGVSSWLSADVLLPFYVACCVNRTATEMGVDPSVFSSTAQTRCLAPS
jgi:hypothetical protein